MKAPSLDAIRKFKQQQERLKREQDELRAKTILSNLEHRAAQGDRKAKSELKKIDKTKEEQNKQSQLQYTKHYQHYNQQQATSTQSNNNNNNNNGTSNKNKPHPYLPAGVSARPGASGLSHTKERKVPRPRLPETNFDELMNLAKQNTNEIKKLEPKTQPPPQQPPKRAIPRLTPSQRDLSPPPAKQSNQQQQPVRPRPGTSNVVNRHSGTTAPIRSTEERSKLPIRPSPAAKVVSKAPLKNQLGPSRPQLANPRLQQQPPIRTQQPPARPQTNVPNSKAPTVIEFPGGFSMVRPPQRPPTNSRPGSSRIVVQGRPSGYSHYNPRDNDYDDDDDEEEYADDDSLDDFVVDDDENDGQEDINQQIRSMFGYDRRRCDLREQALDREYRAIGRVSTFEDLEREERRAAKLSAAEDVREQKAEEERKRRKKLRLQQQG